MNPLLKRWNIIPWNAPSFVIEARTRQEALAWALSSFGPATGVLEAF